MTTPLSRRQWAVRAVLALGVAASVIANVLHARDNLISQAIAAWPPLALLLTVELITRIPVHRWALGVARIVATTAIAGIAAWISYHHMVAVVARYGESGTVPYLLPLSVDGLIIVASICLVELAGRRDHANTVRPAAHPAQPTPAADVAATAPPAASDMASDRAPNDHDGGQPEPKRPSALTTNPDADDGNREDQDAQDEDDQEDDQDEDDLAPDLVPLLPAARTARDELVRQGRTVSRDALAHQLRRNGHAIRNTRVSELLTALRRDEPSPNGTRPTVSA